PYSGVAYSLLVPRASAVHSGHDRSAAPPGIGLSCVRCVGVNVSQLGSEAVSLGDVQSLRFLEDPKHCSGLARVVTILSKVIEHPELAEDDLLAVSDVPLRHCQTLKYARPLRGYGRSNGWSRSVGVVAADRAPGSRAQGHHPFGSERPTSCSRSSSP